MVEALADVLGRLERLVVDVHEANERREENRRALVSAKVKPLRRGRLSAEEKFHAIQEFRQLATQPVQSVPQASTRGEQSPAVINKGDTAIGNGVAPVPAGMPRPPASDQAPSAGSVHTEGNQSPAANSGGNVGIQYGTSAPKTVPPASRSTTGGNQSPAVNASGNVTINYAGMTPEEKAAFSKQVVDTSF